MRDQHTPFPPKHSLASFAGFGIVDVDWSNAKNYWKNDAPQDCEEKLTQQVAQIHAVDPTTKVWTYKNLVKVSERQEKEGRTLGGDAAAGDGDARARCAGGVRKRNHCRSRSELRITSLPLPESCRPCSPSPHRRCRG